jgi:hypothetical protein
MEFLEIPLFDDDVYKLLVRFAFNLVFLALVVWVSYHRHQKNYRYVFNFLIMNVMVFFICFTLKKMELGLGMALGLFAIFTIIRYRTDAIAVKDMTYLFVVIGIAVINALSNKKTSYTELLATNLIIFGATYLLETALARPTKPKLKTRDVVYDKLELLHPGNEEQLNADIKQRIGIEPARVDVKKIDLQKGCASIAVRYDAERN